MESDVGRADDQRRLNATLPVLLGKEVTIRYLDANVVLWFGEPVDQSLILVSPFMIGPPDHEEIVVPGKYGASIARVLELLGSTVTSATTEPSIYELRVTFSNGSRLVVPRHPFEAHPMDLAEWVFWAGPLLDPNNVWFIDCY